MNQKVKIRLGLNISLTIIFGYLNIRALEMGLEETFIAYALAFGLVVTMVNCGVDMWGKKD